MIRAVPNIKTSAAIPLSYKEPLVPHQINIIDFLGQMASESQFLLTDFPINTCRKTEASLSPGHQSSLSSLTLGAPDLLIGLQESKI